MRHHVAEHARGGDAALRKTVRSAAPAPAPADSNISEFEVARIAAAVTSQLYLSGVLGREGFDAGHWGRDGETACTSSPEQAKRGHAGCPDWLWCAELVPAGQ
jgi:hypothetical protein